ncbi:MAG: cytochrome c1 [Gammaproteobacteria bacterium]|nr:cytochrome c1 [Gammaproteobacteria bacterium]NKB64124.1 cytochrome c1 [Gammaproteobacteria bacterium]
MRLKFVAVLLVLLPAIGLAASVPKMKMDHVEIALNNKTSLQNGAKLFVNYCLSCHSAQYMRYNRMAVDLGIPEDVVKKNMIFTDTKIGDLMETTMNVKDATTWFGVAPPDLSLIGRLRDPEWLYNYLRSFYLDESSPSGWNNVVFENVAMPHALYELQGQRRAVFKTVTDADGQTVERLDHFELIKPGKMTLEEYDDAMKDLTNFLVYLGEPAKMVRTKYGIWVIVFLLVFGALAFALKKEYWRDVH